MVAIIAKTKFVLRASRSSKNLVKRHVAREASTRNGPEKIYSDATSFQGLASSDGRKIIFRDCNVRRLTQVRISANSLVLVASVEEALALPVYMVII